MIPICTKYRKLKISKHYLWLRKAFFIFTFRGLCFPTKRCTYVHEPGSEIWRESRNPFSQRFSSTKFRESKWILLNISVYHTKLYGANPWILAKFTGRIKKGSRTWLRISDPVSTKVTCQGHLRSQFFFKLFFSL